MNLNTKPIIIIFIIAVLVLIITLGIVRKSETGDVSMTAASDQVNTVQDSISKKSPVKVQKKVSFKSNDEIKKEYGKLETVFLWNGKKYTGAVISTDPVYSIVTVEGTVNIPIKDVKIREIIR